MKRTIKVTGIGRAVTKPDQITLPIRLTAIDPDYAKAAAMAEEQLASVQDALRVAGFAPEDLVTTDFDVSAEYDNRYHPDGTNQRVFLGYRRNHGLCLRFPLDPDRLALVLTALAGCGAVPECSVEFTVRDPNAVRTELLADAARDARAKAEALCAALGEHLGQLLRVNHNSGMGDFCSPTRMNLGMADGFAAKRMEFTPDTIDSSDSAEFVWELE